MSKNNDKKSGASAAPARPADAEKAARDAAAAFGDRRVLAPASVAEFSEGLMAAAAAMEGGPEKTDSATAGNSASPSPASAASAPESPPQSSAPQPPVQAQQASAPPSGGAEAQHGSNGQAGGAQDAANQRLRALKNRFHQIVGEVVMLMSGHSQHEHNWLLDLKTSLFPAVALRQFKIIRGSNDQTVGFVSWAKVNEEAEERLKQTGRLRPADWDSGDRVVLVEVIGPSNKAEDELAEKIRADVFENIPIKRLRRGGRNIVLEPVS